MQKEKFNDLDDTVKKIQLEIETYKKYDFFGTPISMLLAGAIGYLMGTEIESTYKESITPLLYLTILFFMIFYYFYQVLRPKDMMLREMKQFVPWYQDFGKHIQER